MIEVELDDAFSRLSRAIQDRKVILWAGAGLSSDAGYPTGTGLANLLLERLGEPLDTGEALSSVAERFVNAKERENLDLLLSEIFDGVRESRIHQRIAEINRFPYIITTNYDPLFDNAFGEDLLVIRDESELSSTASAGEKTILYKIHGDSRQPKTMVITESDYRRLDESSLLWEVLRARLAEYSILFIGYSLRDPNTVKNLQAVLTRLGEHANLYYLIDLKVDGIVPEELAEALIELIQSSAVEAIERIYDHICDVPILESRSPVDIERNRGLCRVNGVKLDYRVDSEGHLKYARVSARDRSRPVNVHGNLRSTLPSDSELGRHFLDLLQGIHFEDVEIGEEYDPQLEVWANRLRLLGLGKYKKIRLSRNPNERSRVDLQLGRDPSLRLENIWLNVYYSETHYKVDLSDRWFTLSFYGPRITQSGNFFTTIQLSFHKLMPSVGKAKVVFSLLDAWFRREEIDVIRHAGKEPFLLPQLVKESTDPAWKTVDGLKNLYSDLDLIERKAKVKFKPRREISIRDQQRIAQIAALLRGEKHHLDTVTGTMTRINREAFPKNTTRTIGGLQLSGDGWRRAKILNKVVEIPIVVEGQNLDLVNYDEVMARFDEGADEIPFSFDRGGGEIYARYEPSRSTTQPQELNLEIRVGSDRIYEGN